MDRSKSALATARRLNRIVGASRLFVDIERLWTAARWPLLVICLFLIVALFNLLPTLPAFLHALILTAFAAALIFAGYRMFRHFRPAGRSDALRRLETDNGFSHAPLRTLDDKLAGGGDDPLTQALWDHHQARLAKLAQETRLRPPRSELPVLDPWAIRVGVLLILVVALVDADGRIGRRLADALIPGAVARASIQPIETTLWIEPPAYTRLPPRQIQPSDDRVGVPTGSQALVQVHHLPQGSAAPSVKFDDVDFAATRLGEASAEARFAIRHDGDLLVQDEDKKVLSRFLLSVQPDQPPAIRRDGEPGTTVRQALEVAWTGSDDYGLVSTALEMRPVDGSRPPERIVLRSLPDQPREAKGSSYLDLTPHPLAGAKVHMVLIAVDAAGQEGRSEPFDVTLPERRFTNPMAKAIIDQRKKLAADPSAREVVADALEQLANTRMMKELPSSVPLSLSSSAERLRRDGLSKKELDSVSEQLWETALSVEEGRMATAESDMRRLQDQLEKALADGRPDAEIEKLMDQLQEAMNRYLDEMTRKALAEAMRDPKAMADAMRRQQEQQAQQSQNSVNRQDLQKMLDKARELMKGGSREAAEQMLAQLRQMMENLQARLPMQQSEPAPGEQALSDLQDAIRRQQMLQDQAFKMDRQMSGQEGEQGQQGQPQMTPDQLAKLQEMLRRQLGDIMQGLAEQGMKIPDQLGKAELQMRGAQGQLEQGSPGAATDPQGQAMALMQEGGQSVMNQMRQQMGEGQGQGRPGGQPGRPPGQTQTGWQRDPFGRQPEGMGGLESETTSVPDEAALGRARAVLEELYRRSADPNRSRMELDYYDRLLKQY